jgi:Flp pilus assembly protein TadG
LAELAIVIPITLALLVVVFDLGRGFLAYVSVSNAARDGARAAMDDGTDCAPSETSIGTAVTSAADPYTVTWTAAADPDDADLCRVTVNHTYTPILPFVTASFSVPMMGTVGPLWNGNLSETMVAEMASASP